MGRELHSPKQYYKLFEEKNLFETQCWCKFECIDYIGFFNLCKGTQLCVAFTLWTFPCSVHFRKILFFNTVKNTMWTCISPHSVSRFLHYVDLFCSQVTLRMQCSTTHSRTMDLLGKSAATQCPKSFTLQQSSSFFLDDRPMSNQNRAQCLRELKQFAFRRHYW